MANIGFAKLTIMGKIKLVLHLLNKYKPQGGYWYIEFTENLFGGIGYLEFDKEYDFEDELELERTLLEIYEELKDEEK